MAGEHSLRDVIASLPADKRKADGPWTTFVLRPLSFPVAWALLALGVTPNAVTYASAFLCVVGFVLLAVPHPVAVYSAFSLFFLFGILDCVDGNMARMVKRPNPMGEWVDALGGYVAYATFLLGIGIAAEIANGSAIPLTGLRLPWAGGGWVLLGAIASSANLLMRATFQNYRALRPEEGRSGVAGEKRLSEAIGITGLLVPASAAAYAAGVLPFVVAAYAGIYGGGCLLVVLKLAAKAGKG
ncbi:MAG: CDP-alcohol phosphatidyltransferase family protein [Spirochaetes bacterium]|nr:CDP-alcohol phosphatidyltransferase family protein [Spirochaetota bacterium]